MSECLSPNRAQITNVSVDVEKREPVCTVGGMKTGAAAVEKSMEFPQKTKSGTTIRLKNLTPGYISEKKNQKPTNLKRHIHPNVHSSIIYSCQDMEAVNT